MPLSLAETESPDQGRAPPHDHAVQFYDDDAYLSGVVTSFVTAGISEAQPAVIIATRGHRDMFEAGLECAGVDVARAQLSGMLTLRDARETLATFMVGGMPDWNLFLEHVGGIVDRVAAARKETRLRAYGEMVDLLWRDGNPQAAIRLEEFWNDLANTRSFSLLCAYVMGNFYKQADAGDFTSICRAHAHVFPTESYPRAENSEARLVEVARLQQRARALEHELEQRKHLENELRQALAERRRAEEALRESRQELVDFFENAVEGLHWVGPDGTILWANRAELDLLGYSEEEYVGHNIAEFHVDREIIEDFLARLACNETLNNREARLRCKDGSIRHVLVHSNVLFRDGKFVHTRCFTRDISDRKRLEDELRQGNEQLGRTVKFAEMFVGMLGHDLRNPLSAITTGASLLVRRAESDRVAKPATRILNSAARMARMIDQVLDFTRIRLGQGLPLERKRTDLGEVCRIAMEELDGSSRDCAIRLETSGDLVGHWDEDRLTQLLSNLLGNALAHGSPPVSVQVDGTDPLWVSLQVVNAGAIAADMLPLVFEPFRSTANRKHERSSGLGLGLYISQQVAEAHSGTIGVVSSESEGTRFTVRLPRSDGSSK